MMSNDQFEAEIEIIIRGNDLGLIPSVMPVTMYNRLPETDIVVERAIHSSLILFQEQYSGCPLDYLNPRI